MFLEENNPMDLVAKIKLLSDDPQAFGRQKQLSKNAAYKISNLDVAIKKAALISKIYGEK